MHQWNNSGKYDHQIFRSRLMCVYLLKSDLALERGVHRINSIYGGWEWHHPISKTSPSVRWIIALYRITATGLSLLLMFSTNIFPVVTVCCYLWGQVYCTFGLHLWEKQKRGYMWVVIPGQLPFFHDNENKSSLNSFLFSLSLGMCERKPPSVLSQ